MTGWEPGVVTPEGVVLQVPRAGPASRMLARLIDTAVQFGLLLVFALADRALSGGALGTVGSILLLFAVPLVIFGYPAVLEGTWGGRTLGKAALGLRVLTRDGGPIRFRQALIRSVMYFFDGLLFTPAVGILLLILSRDTVRIGDRVAGTMVVREKTGAAAPRPVAFRPPPGFEDFAARLDVSRITASDYEVVRSLLVRAYTLPPEVRWQLASQVARPISRKLGYRSPPQMHPETFLACAAAAFQYRSSLAARPSGYPPAAAASAALFQPAADQPPPYQPAPAPGAARPTPPAEPGPFHPPT